MGIFLQLYTDIFLHYKPVYTFLINSATGYTSWHMISFTLKCILIDFFLARNNYEISSCTARNINYLLKRFVCTVFLL